MPYIVGACTTTSSSLWITSPIETQERVTAERLNREWDMMMRTYKSKHTTPLKKEYKTKKEFNNRDK